MVNRMWALLFNRPLSAPVDDIPLEGPYPPGLEILAQEFTRSGYDLRHLIRLMVLSQPFQLASHSGDPAHPVTKEAEQAWAAFPVTRLRPEQMAGSVVQAASLSTIDHETHVAFRLKRYFDVENFVKRYGDSGEDAFEDGGGTIPQRLLLMNGNLVANHTGNNPVINASTRIGMLAPDDASAVEAAYLSALTRRPSPAEKSHFTEMLASAGRREGRTQAMADMCWTLLNSTEFSWNH
jgi:hypothetical protein